LQLYRRLALTETGEYQEPDHLRDCGTAEEPTLKRDYVNLSVDARSVTIIFGKNAHHTIVYKRESEQHTPGRWAYTTVGPQSVARRSVKAYSPREYKRDSSTGLIDMTLWLHGDPSEADPHRRRASNRYVQAVIAHHQSCLSKLSDAGKVKMRYNWSGNKSAPAEEVLDESHELVMRTACMCLREAIDPDTRRTAEVPIRCAVLGDPFSEGDIKAAGFHRLSATLGMWQTTTTSRRDEERRRLHLLSANIGRDMGAKLWQEFTCTTVTGTDLQKARLMDALMRHTAHAAFQAAVNMVDAMGERGAVEDGTSPQWGLNLCLTPFRDLTGDDPDTEPPSMSASKGFEVAWDVFPDYLDGVGCQRAFDDDIFGPHHISTRGL
jgi:hypothetical protein